MCQMAAMVKIHPHNRIARIADGKLNGKVCLSAGMGLHIGIIAAKQFFCPFNRQIFHYIHAFAPAIISFSRISFRIFVGKRAAHRRHHGFADPVFRCNQFNMAVLPVLFIHNRLRNFRIYLLHFIQ